MDDRELVHVFQGFENLNAESFGQRHREALEIIVFDKLV